MEKTMGEKSHSDEMAQRSTFSSTNEEVVGFQKDAESMIQRLMAGTKELDIVSIVGMPGLGKTTLARKVFNHFIDKHFDVRAWCSISKKCNLQRVFSELLKQAIGNVNDDIKDEDMPDKLRKSLMRKRYLIVLDDVWEVKVWEELRLSFPHDENGSRIMVTTRDEEVADQLKHLSDPYFLPFLTTAESWELIQKKVFQGESCPRELLKVGIQVAKNCKGLPLVIVLVAGILAKNRQVSSWLEVANDLSSHVLEDQSMKILESSYDYLEDHLKACLLYMGLFPEDHRFLVSDLLMLWIAENFVQEMDVKNMEEASKFCLNDLVNRSLVLVLKRSFGGEIKYCTVHDVVREFCLRKLREEKFMQLVIPYNPYHKPLDAKKPQLCLYMHDDLVEQLAAHEYSLDKVPSLSGFMEEESFVQCQRSFDQFIIHPKLYAPEQTVFFTVLDNLRLIRVLHLLEAINLQSSWATAIQVLTHLRYLAILTKEFDFQWVAHLVDLHTLRVVWKNPTTNRIMTSPAIWKMQKLRHVDIQDFSFSWEENDGEIFKAESSETLSVLPNLKTFGKCCIYLADMNPEFWWRFPNIEQLNLHFVEPEVAEDVEYYQVPTPEVDMPNLEQLQLQSLQVSFTHTILTYESIGWGSCVTFPLTLKDLSLDSIFLTEKIVSNIARLQNLERLKLRKIHFKGEGNFRQPGYRRCWDVSEYEFQALKFLKLQAVHMTEWCTSEASFPVLEKIVIDGCWQLQDIPSSFVDIPELKLIKLIGCAESLEVSALNIKKEIEDITGYHGLRVHIVRK